MSQSKDAAYTPNCSCVYSCVRRAAFSASPQLSTAPTMLGCRASSDIRSELRSTPLQTAGNYSVLTNHKDNGPEKETADAINNNRNPAVIGNFSVKVHDNISRRSLRPVGGRQKQPEISASPVRILGQNDGLIRGLGADTSHQGEIWQPQIGRRATSGAKEFLTFVGREEGGLSCGNAEDEA